MSPTSSTMLGFILISWTFLCWVHASDLITIIDVVQADGLDDFNKTEETVISFETVEDLDNLTFFWNHGDGKRDWDITMLDSNFTHTYTRRGIYTGRVTVRSNDSYFGSAEYTVRIGNIQISECYPLILEKETEYEIKYSYLTSNDEKTSTSSFTPSESVVDHSITRDPDTIDNPCQSIVRQPQVEQHPIHLVNLNSGLIITTEFNITFSFGGLLNITGAMNICRIDFGDLTHSAELPVSTTPINDLIADVKHTYHNPGVFYAIGYCWNDKDYTKTGTVATHVYSGLNSFNVRTEIPVMDIHNPKLVGLILEFFIYDSPGLLDTTINVNWGDGEMDNINIFEITEGDNVLPVTHNYTRIGTFTITVETTNPESGLSYHKTVVFMVSESMNLTLVLQEVEGFLLSEEPLAINVTNITTYDISYTIDFGSASVPKIEYGSPDLTALFSGFPPHMGFSYDYGGTYTITLTASNAYFSVLETLDIIVLQGVPKKAWSLAKKKNEAVIIDESDVKFKLIYHVNRTIVPTVNIECSMDYGDGLYGNKFDVSFPHTVHLGDSHVFVQLGSMAMNLTCKNMYSEYNLTLDLDVLTYTQSNYKFYYLDALGINGTLETLNTVKTWFSFLLYDIRSVVFPHTVQWDFGDGTPVITKTLYSWGERHLYEKRTVYDGNVMVSTPKGNFTYNFRIYIGVTLLMINPSAGLKNTSIGITFAEKRSKLFSGIIEYGDGKVDSTRCTGSCFLPHFYMSNNFYDVKTTVTVDSIVEQLLFPKAVFIDNTVTGLSITASPNEIQQPPGRVRLEIGMHAWAQPIKYMECSVDLGDELDRRIHYLDGSLDSLSTFTMEGSYMSLGYQTISANCSNRIGEQIISTTVQVKAVCFGGDGIFEKLYADPKTPMLIMASTDVEITSRAIILCNQNPINFTWSLWTLNERVFDRNTEISIEQPHRDSFRITKGLLNPMLYSLELNVSTISLGVTQWLLGLTYVRIIGSPLIVKFKGGSIKATGYSDAKVNAALMSYDPDKASKSEYNMTFTWTCRYFETATVSELDLAVSRYDPGFETDCDNFSIEISPGIRQFHDLPDKQRGYFFRVSAESMGKTSEDNAESYVQYTRGAPEVDIECVVNCEVKTARRTQIVMEVRCLYCFREEFYDATLTWTLSKWLTGNTFANVANFDDIKDFIEDNPVAIIIPKDTLEGCKKYRLKVLVDMPSRQAPGEAFTDFTVNCPPSDGYCITDPLSGEARNTSFQTTCRGWLDDGYGPTTKKELRPFIYKFYISQGIYIMPLFQGAQSLTPYEPLPVIPGTKGGKYIIVSRIFDSLNDYTEFNTTVELTVPTLRSLDEIGDANQAEFTSGVAKDTSVLSKQLVMTTFSSSILQTVEVDSLNTFLNDFTNVGDGSGANKNASWNTVWNKFMGNRKDKSLKEDISKKYKTFVEQVNDKFTNASTLDGYGLEALGEALATVMHTEDTVDFEITNRGNELINSGTAALESLSKQEPFPIKDKVDDVVFSMTGALDTIYNKNTPSYQARDTQIDVVGQGVSEDEKQMFSLMIMNEQAENDETKIARGKEMLPAVENSTETLLSIMLKDQVMGQLSKTIKREGISLTARKITARTLKESGFDADSYSMQFPGAKNDTMNTTNNINLKASVTKKNLYSFASDGSSYDITSPVLSLKMDDANGTNHFDGSVSLKIKRDVPPFNVYQPNQTRQGEEGFFHHQFQVKKTSDSTFVYVDIGGRRGGTVGAYIRNGEAPVSYATDVKYVTGEYVTFSHGKRKKRAVKTVVKFVFKPGDLDLGFNYFGLDFGDMADSITEYSFLAYSDSCRVWDRHRQVWENTSCTISPYSTPEETVCDCRDAPGHNFASSFYVPPNLINFNVVFGKFDAENAAVYGTLCGLFFVFGLAAIWARRKGRVDERRWGVGYLQDNLIDDHYFYLLTVHTGLTGSSGTTSRVSFIITGQSGDTGVRLLFDGERHLETGTVMAFIMASSECLGNLKFLRIWHDNSGKGADQSWYLSRLVVEDIQTNTRSVFMCDDWLALDKSDGVIDRVIPVAFEDDMMTFSKLFSEHNRINLSDTHLWLSILLRPEKSMFTRVQRVATCLATLLLAMISSALFYQPEDKEGKSSNNSGSEVQIGTMRFSMTTLYTSTVGLLITVPPILLVVNLFKNRRPWTKKICCCSSGRKQMQLSESKTALELSSTSDICNEHNIEQDPLSSKYEKNILPPCCLVVGWAVLLLCILLCSFFLILYSMQWGKTVAEEWLASFVLSFFGSIFIMDPIKVLLLSTLLALCMRKPQGEPESDKMPIDVIKQQSTIHGCTEIDPTILPPDPIPEAMLEKARQKKRQESLANSVFIELIVYVLFVFCIFCVSYGNRDARSFNLNNHIQNHLVHPPYRKVPRWYYGSSEEALTWSKLRNVEDIYTWLNSTMQDNMFPWNSYNGLILPWTQRLFMKDLANYRVGPVRLRQARMPRERPYSIKEDPSLTGPHITHQENLLGNQERSEEYDIKKEETGDYCWKWVPLPCSKLEKTESLTPNAWRHRSTREEKSFPVIGKFAIYSGAGYVFDLQFNKFVITQLILSELRDNDWLDIQTRAVFVEFTLYNVNVNLFTSVRLAAEIPEYGGIFTWADVKPLRIYDHTGGLGALMLICQLIGIIVTIVLIVKVVKKLWSQRCKYFLETWNILDLAIVTLCLSAFIAYIIRKVLVTRVMGTFKRNPKAFANFYEAVFCDDIYGWMLAAIVFLCTLRIMRILGYNRRILMIATVLQRAAPGLFSFSLLFGIIITAFMTTGHALFQANLESFMTLWDSYITILYLLMGKNVFKKMVMVSAVLSRVYFFLLAVLIVFVFLTIFQAILNFTITEVHTDVANAPVPYGIMDILHKAYASMVLDNRIVEKLKQWGGSKTETPDKAESKPSQPTMETDAHHIQKIFSVLRDHFNTNLEYTKELPVVSPRQVNIDEKKRKKKKKKKKKKNSTPDISSSLENSMNQPRLQRERASLSLMPNADFTDPGTTTPDQDTFSEDSQTDVPPATPPPIPPSPPPPPRSVWASGITVLKKRKY